MYDFRFEDLDDETEVTLDASCRGTGLRWRLVALVVGLRTARSGGDGLYALKRMIEESAGRRAGGHRTHSLDERSDRLESV